MKNSILVVIKTGVYYLVFVEYFVLYQANISELKMGNIQNLIIIGAGRSEVCDIISDINN